MAAPQIIGKIAVQVMPDTSKFKEQARVKLAKIEKELDLRLELELDITKFKKQLDKVKKEIDHWKRQNNPIKLGVEVNLLPGKLAFISARLAWLTRMRTVNIVPVLNEGALGAVIAALGALSGGRVLGDLLEDIWNIGKRFDRLVPKIGAVAMALAFLSTIGLTSLSNLSALTVSLAQMVTAGLALPGIFAGIGIGIGVAVVGLMQMKKEVPDLFSKFTKLKSVIGKNFWAEAADGIRTLVDLHLPQLGKTATLVGTFFGKMAESLAGPFKKALPAMFSNLNESIGITTKNTGVFASIITSLGLVGSEYLPRLAEWFNKITTQFDNFLKKADADGSLQEWIEQGITNIKAFFNILKSAGQIIYDIGSAASAGGGSTLEILADTMERIRDVTSSPVFQSTLTQVFATAHAVMGAIANESGPAVVDLFKALADTFIKIGPALSEGLGVAIGAIAGALADPALQEGIQQVFTGLADAIVALAPALPPVAEALGALAPVIVALLNVIAPLVTAALIPLSEAFITLAPLLVPIIEMLGAALLDAVVALAPLLQAIALVFVEIIEQAMPLATMLIDMLVPAFEALVSWITPLVEQFTPLVPAILGAYAAFKLITTGIAFVQFLSQLALAIGLVGVWAVQTVASVVMTVASWVVGVATIVANIAIYVAQSIASAARAAAAWAAGAARTVASLVLTAVGFVAQGAVIVASMAATAAQVVAKWVLMAVQSLLQAARMAAAWLIAMGPVGWVIAAVIGLVAIIIANWDKVKAFTIAAWNKLSGAISSAVSFVVGFVKNNWQKLLMLITGPIGLAVGLVVKHWDKIKSAFKAGVDGIMAFVKSIPGKIRGFFGNAGSILLTAGRNIIQGFLSGITAGFQRVKDALGRLTSFLPDWKGPAERDKNILTDAGRLVIQGFITGLESQYSAVERSLSGLSADISSTVMASPASAKLGNLNGAAVDGALAGGAGGAKVFNYYAAPGSSLGSEEDLFEAAGRSRMVGW